MNGPRDRFLATESDEDASRALIAVRAAAKRLASAYPFHAAILARLIVVANRSLPTAGVTARSEGVYLIVNPMFLLGITEDEVVGVLHHEVNHILFGHVFTPRGAFEDQRALVIAQEVTVNEWVPEPLPGRPLVLARYPKLPANEDTATRYRRLARPPLPNSKKRRAPRLQTVDDHGVWADAVDAGEAAWLAARILVRAAAERIGPRAWMRLPPALREAVVAAHGPGGGAGRGSDIEALLGTGASTVDWRGALRRLVTAETGRESRYGRPPRRFPHLAGVVPGTGRASVKPKLLAVVDTSGSVNHTMLEDIAAELRALSKTSTVTIAECDTEIHDVYAFDGRMKQATGRGGTDLRPPFDLAFLREHRPDAVVYFTDGDGPAPASGPRVPVYWCLTEGGRRPANWGRVLQMRA